MTDSPAPHTPRSEVLPGEEVKDDLGEVVERVTQIGLTLGSGGRYTILPNSAFHADLRTLLSALSKAQEERDANGRLLAAATKRLSDYTKDHVAAGAALTSLRAEVVKVVEPFAGCVLWVGWDELHDNHWIDCRPINRSNGPTLECRHFRALAALHASLTGGKE
jgi:hypothetical protein